MKQLDPFRNGHSGRDTEIIRVGIFESTPIACELLRTALSRVRSFQVVACCTDSHKVQDVLDHRPDVLLVSAQLADGVVKGFRVVRAARDQGNGPRCVILVDEWSPELVVDAFRVGARGIFHRADSFQHLCRCLSVVCEGQIWANTIAVSYLINALQRVSPMRVVSARGEELLTAREKQVVSLVVDGLNNREISEQLHVSEHTVKNHLFHVFEKLGISSRVELVLYALSQRQQVAA